MINKNLYSLIVAGLIFIIVFGWGGYFYGRKAGERIGKEASQKELADLKQRIKLFFPSQPAEIFSISGSIKEIGKDFLKIEYFVPSELPLLPGETAKKELRKVAVNQNTKIIKIDFSSFSQGMPPKPSELQAGPKEIKISLSDLKVGENISVTAKENIKDKKEFSATIIQKF